MSWECCCIHRTSTFQRQSAGRPFCPRNVMAKTILVMNGRVPTRADAGFSLLEVLLAVGLLAAVAFTAFAYFGTGQSDARTAAMELVSALRAARAEAIHMAREVEFVMSAQSRTYGVSSSAKRHPIPKHFSLIIEARDQCPQGTNDASILFFPDGTSSGARIQISGGSGRNRTIIVDWASSS